MGYNVIDLIDKAINIANRRKIVFEDIRQKKYDIQGRFVKNTSDINTKTYKTFSHIINNIGNHIITLENILK